MPMKIKRLSWFLLSWLLAGTTLLTYSQDAKFPAAPRIEVQNCDLSVTLAPDSHAFKAVATLRFRVLEQANTVAFALSENVSIQKVLTSQGVELQFDQNQAGPEILSVRFSAPLSVGTTETIRVEFEGGFDRDRFSRLYSRDVGSAYIGMEGTYLMYAARWFPVSQFLVNRAAGTLEVTVPLGMTVIGPGQRTNVLTRGIQETFVWTSSTPILPGTFVAGQYFPRKVQAGEYTIECFARENKLESIARNAEIAGKILAYYREAYGPPAAGNQFRLVEVEDALARQHGMSGTIFITRSELAQSTPPVRELARRIAAQWWVETVGVQNSGDLWLADGLAYFSAAQYLEHSAGAAAFKEEMDALAVLALKFENKSAVRTGLELGYRTDKYESVVAGKGAWIVHMLRGLLGEAKFLLLLPQYLREHASAGGGTAALQTLAEKLYEKELGWFFTEWVDTIGVPTFQSDYALFKTVSGFRVSGAIKQEQDLFRMPIEVAVVGKDGQELKTIELNGKSTAFDIATFSMPEKVVLDPANKLLRDSRELRTSVQLAMGNDLIQAGSYVEAVRAYEEALKLSPHRSLAHFRLAEAFFEQFNLQSAANSFRDALNGDKDPKWIEVWCYIYLGKIYDILGQRQRAMAEYTKALNTKDDTNGAQAEAGKWLAAPFTRERTVMDTDARPSE